MPSKEHLTARLAEMREKYGAWTYDIPLPHGIWTRGSQGPPDTRLKRVLQLAGDLGGKPLQSCRVLDLGCLEGKYSIEFAMHGARVLGIEAREASFRKAVFARDVLQLDGLEFAQDDVRNISVQKYGRFDIVVCSGLLYHLNVPDVFSVVEQMYEMVERVLVLDTHISLTPSRVVAYGDREYRGHEVREHSEREEEQVKAGRVLASWGNDVSFFFTRPSLVNLLSHSGFSSVYECFNPPHLNFGRPGLEHLDRCTFAAVKGSQVHLHTSLAANTLDEDHPEGSLTYPLTVPEPAFNRSLVLGARLRRKLRSLVGGGSR